MSDSTLKILIIGLRPEQCQRLRQEFQQFDICELSSQAQHKRPLKGDFDYIVSVTKFTNHSTERLYTHHHGYIRLSHGQGMSSIRHLLTQLPETTH